MKKLLMFSVIILSFIPIFGQESNEPFNKILNEIILRQLFNNYEGNVPIIIAVPGFFMYANIQYTNADWLIEQSIVENIEFTKRQKYAESELTSLINFQSFPPLPFDSSLQLKGSINNRLAYTLTCQRKGYEQIFTLSLPDEKTEKTSTYIKGQIKNVQIKRGGKISFIDFKDFGDSLRVMTTYDTKSKKYAVTEDRYRDSLLITRTFFGKSKDRDDRKIKRVVAIDYGADGKVSKKYFYQKDGSVSDSIIYYYSNGYLNSMIKIGKTKQSAINYNFENGLLLSKFIVNGDSKTEIEYGYNGRNKPKKLLIKDIDKITCNKYALTYNIQGSLISVKHLKLNTIDSNQWLISQFLFKYNDNNRLQSFKEIDAKGRVVKEITLEFEYLEDE